MSSTSRSRARTVNRLLDASGLAVWLLDSEGRLVYLSAAMADWLGRSPENCLGVTCCGHAGERPDQAFSDDSPTGPTPVFVPASGFVPTNETAGDVDLPSSKPSNSPDWAASLAPATGLLARGYQTRRIAVSHPDGLREQTAHFVLLDARRHQDGLGIDQADASTATRSGGKTAPGTASDLGRMVLGCLGDFLSDFDLPLRDWQGAGGLREAARIRESIDRQRLRQRQLTSWAVLGESPSARRLRRRVGIAGSLRSHVGIFGPDGSGATSLAWHIHHQSAVNEPALMLDGSLMDVELLEAYGEPLLRTFRENRQSTGTLIVEHLHELRPEAQQQLLNWLRQWPDRLRLIGCINRKIVLPKQETPEAELARRTGVPLPDSALDPELWDMLAALPILIPSLQARLQDIPELSAAMIQDFAGQQINQGSNRTTTAAATKPTFLDIPRLSEEALDLLQLYPWPGNLEELAEALRNAVSAVTGDPKGELVIEPAHLPLAIRSFRPSGTSAKPAGGVKAENETFGLTEASDFRIDSLDQALSAYEQELIGKAMKAAGGNKAEAARRLGISRARLLRKLAESPGKQET